MVETIEEIKARHRKELKNLDGEKRAAIKKAKSTKAKKAKEAIAILETEFEGKLKELEAKHKEELAGASGDAEEANEEAVSEIKVATKIEEGNNIPAGGDEVDRKKSKAQRKREKAREKERARENEIAQEVANAGPSARIIESNQIMQQLEPLHLEIDEVAADGHCLYRAVAAQCGKDYQAMRSLCADTLAEHPDDFSAFCEYNDTSPDFSSYVNRVRSSADWGGHLELRVLSLALKRPVWVYSAQNAQPLILEGPEAGDGEPIRLSYHLHYYALGEHYNQVIVTKS